MFVKTEGLNYFEAITAMDRGYIIVPCDDFCAFKKGDGDKVLIDSDSGWRSCTDEEYPRPGWGWEPYAVVFQEPKTATYSEAKDFLDRGEKELVHVRVPARGMLNCERSELYPYIVIEMANRLGWDIIIEEEAG